MSLWLKPQQALEIVGLARAAAPQEVCGLLLGRGNETLEIVPARNVKPQPERGFVVAPQDLAAALMRADRENLQLVGVYHSHPTSAPIPSARDIREAHYPDAIQLIVGLNGDAPELAAWCIVSGRVSRAMLLIQSDRPIPSVFGSARLSASQRLAVLTAGLLAVVIVLVVAFTLLPPPELPT